MRIVMIALYFIGREITLFVCLSLCSGTWRKIKARIKPKHIAERVFLFFLMKAETRYAHIIRFFVIFINAELINTITCAVLYCLNCKDYLFIWAIIWLLHFSVFTFIIRKYVRK